jgi:hypothetical protein
VADKKQEYEQLWDVLGIGLMLVAATSFALIFTGSNPVFAAFTTENITGHLLGVGLGFVLAEGGVRKLVRHVFSTLHD